MAEVVGDERAIRVFVSSTFRDMQLERDELVKRVFPKLRKLCEQRGVTWSEVDLRWGVTDEQKAEGAVLPICLAEIDRTRPYFIGLLGQRYGWVPDELDPTLVEQLGWLTDDTGRSVTELEIVHGVLNDPDAAGQAFFYLRDPAWVEALPNDEQATFLEESATGVERLAALRQRVRDSGLPTADYTDPISLGEQILIDMTRVIETRFPLGVESDAGTRWDAVQAAFGRARFGLFVPRPEIDAVLDVHASGDGPPLLMTGESGVGVSAAVTEWTGHWKAAHPDQSVFVHHVDADTEASDHRRLAARLIAHVSGQQAGAVFESLAGAGVPQVRSALGQALRATPQHTLIVIDGVDRLDDVDRAPDLRWLPTELPANVRLVLTASGDRPRTAAELRRWTIHVVQPLTDDQRRAVAITVLAAASKGLDPENLDALVAGPRTGNARFLRTVLDELRQHGDHFTLRALIDRLVAAESTDDLLEMVLARYETDFERDRPGLTRDVFTAVWAARNGLAEAELLDLLDTNQAVWAPLHLAAEHGLVSRGGLLGFAHPDLQRAVEDRYLTDDDARRAAHARLAAYFTAQELSDRVADELGWQQADAGDRDGLRVTLSDLAFVEHAYRRNPAAIRQLWARLDGTDAGTGMLAAYQSVVADPAAHDTPAADGVQRQLVWGVARLLGDAGEPAAALSLQRYLVEAARLAPEGSRDARGGDAKLRAALTNLGAAYIARGELEAAQPVLAEAVDRCRRAGDPAMLSSALGNLAMVTRDLGRRNEADAMFGEEQALCRQLDDEFGLQASLGNHAQLLREVGRFDDALAVLREQEQVCRHLADPAAIARALAGQATVLADRGDIAEAALLTEQHAAITREEGDLRGLVEALLNLSVQRLQLGDLAAAAAAGDEAEQIARRLGDAGVLARVLASNATRLGQQGQWADAERTAREAELTARNADLPRQAALALGVVGTARRELGDLPGARAAHLEELALAEQAGDEQQAATAQTNLGNVAIGEQHFDEALQRYAIAEAVFRRTDVPSSLLPLLANRAQVHHMSNRFPEAVADYTGAAEAAARMGVPGSVKQWGDPGVGLAYQIGDVAHAERLWAVLAPAARALGSDADLQKALGEHALLLINRSQPQGVVGDHTNTDQALLAQAAVLLDEQRAICERINDPVGLAACVGNQAIVRRYQGDIAGALQAVDQQLDLATRSNNAQGVLFATANRGELLGLLGRVPEALDALGRARATAAQYGIAPMVQQLDQMIAALQARN